MSNAAGQKDSVGDNGSTGPSRLGEDDTVGRFWRSLEEYAGGKAGAAGGDAAGADAASADGGERSFDPALPEGPVVRDLPVGRRRFLQLMGTTVAIPSLAACTRQPGEQIIPYVKQPEDIVPGRPLFYATATLRDGIAHGVLVETHMGRPTKIEGNPDHPTSRGGTDAYAQAEILQLYDPDRSSTVRHLDAISEWGSFLGAMQTAMAQQKAKRGAGLRIMMAPSSSPTLYQQMFDEFAESLPLLSWGTCAALHDENILEGAKLAFGEQLQPRYHLDRAEVILTLDADILGPDEGPPIYAREYAIGRRRGAAGGKMSRHYALESAPTITGARADHRLGVRASDVEQVARAIAAAVGIEGLGVPGAAEAPPLPGVDGPRAQRWLAAVVADLKGAAGRGLVVPGRFQPPVVHALAHAINDRLGDIGQAVSFIAPITFGPTSPDAFLRLLTQEIHEGKVDVLIMLGCNPVYTAPADLEFAAALDKVPLRVHHGMFYDETAERCHWHVPDTHPLEAWSDAHSHDGTLTIMQPMIEPLYASRSRHEMLAALSDAPGRSGYQILRDHYEKQIFVQGDFEAAWRRAVHDGFVAQSERTETKPTLQADIRWPATPPAGADELEIIFRPDPTAYDGTFSNNAWMQELPKPLTKLTWDNAAMVSPATAERLRLETGDVAKLTLAAPEGGAERSLEAPVWVLPGQPDGSVTLHLGYGRTRGGRVAAGAGVDAYRLRTMAGRFHASGLRVEKTGKTYELVTAQMHHSMEGRPLARRAPVEVYREALAQREPAARGKAVAHVFGDHHHGKPKLSMYAPVEYKGYAWGMTIDLSTCTGCSACVVACQSENNIPVVGKVEVARGREMHWLRIDRYYEGDLKDPLVHFQPIPCMQCEGAPCEVVCPVHATVHHDEGLNDMVYNRCIGTKYCSNNCPYKVRRYNFFGYSVDKVGTFDPSEPTVQLSHNPDVTVRTYGVMEKCTYCVQRINSARIDSKRQDRSIRDGEVMTACQAACPTQAITFGDINDRRSEVSRRKAEPRNYRLLEELNTEPRTSYLARLDNPHPSFATHEGGDHGTGHGGEHG